MGPSVVPEHHKESLNGIARWPQRARFRAADDSSDISV